MPTLTLINAALVFPLNMIDVQEAYIEKQQQQMRFFLHITHYYSHGNHLLTFVANTAVNFVHSAVQNTADTLHYIHRV